MRQWRVRLLIILAVMALGASGCSDGGGTSTPAGDGGEAQAGGEAQQVGIVGADYEFTDAPAQLEGGVIDLTFENQGAVAHEVALAGIGDTPVDQFVQDFGPVLEGGPFPDYLDQVAVPIEVEGGASGQATFTVTPGRYVMFCALTGVAKGDKKAPHYELGMIQELTVSGGDAEPQLPEADGTVTATDYAFEADLEAGDSSVNFVNEGPDEVHFASVSLYPEGTDAAAAEEAFKTQLEAEGGGPPPEGVPQPEDVGFTGIFSDGLGSRFQLFEGEFESGRTYLFACFISDRAGGAPHAIAYNMYEAVTIE
jgi:plastocyanin